MERECKVPKCKRRRKARGLCPKHYQRKVRRGSPTYTRCQETRCSKKSKVKGFCLDHYSQKVRDDQFLREISQTWVLQRQVRKCQKCKNVCLQILKIPKVRQKGSVETECSRCTKVLGRRFNLLKERAFVANTYQDWYGIYNYDDEGRLLTWNRSTLDHGQER